MSELRCIECDQRYGVSDLRYHCDCGGLLEVNYSDDQWNKTSVELFDERLKSRKPVDRSGVWRFREVILGLSENEIVTHPEGQTRLYQREALSQYSGIADIYFKHEGENPTGSFKDRGMTCAISQAKRLGMGVVGCASTGNTSAALASYAAQAGLKSIVFLPEGKVAMGKISQAIGYNATCLSIKGDFDDAMKMVQSLAAQGKLYMVNSLNPFRLEGQKSVMWEILQDLSWKAPDWIVVPGGNLGNTSAFGKGLKEAYKAGWIDKLPRIATIQAKGANPFYTSFQQGFDSLQPIQAETIATAVRIGNPVNYPKARRVIQDLNGVVSEVTDEEIMAAKGQIDRVGIGCEPASACSLAGARKLLKEGVIKKSESVVCILTGHMLKDADAILAHSDNHIVEVEAEMNAVMKYL